MKLIIILGMILINILLGGCSTQETPVKLKDLEFTVVEQGAEPDNLHSLIEEKKADPFQLSYIIGDEMYLVVGYGKQDTCGYSIQVKELYETEDTIYFDTTLLGPENIETLNKQESYPYITVKLETITDKIVDFQ